VDEFLSLAGEQGLALSCIGELVEHAGGPWVEVL